MLRPTIGPGRAAKAGLADILSGLTLPSGAAAGLHVLYRVPVPGVHEQRPRAAIVGVLDEEYEQVDGEEIDHGDGTTSVRVGTVSGTLQILLAVEDDVAGDGSALASADEIDAALEQLFETPAAGSLYEATPPEPLHSIERTVAAYHNAVFVYKRRSSGDPPLEVVMRGIAEIAISIDVVGGIYELITAPATDPRLTLVDDVASDTVVIVRSYPDDYPE